MKFDNTGVFFKANSDKSRESENVAMIAIQKYFDLKEKFEKLDIETEIIYLLGLRLIRDLKPEQDFFSSQYINGDSGCRSENISNSQKRGNL